MSLTYESSPSNTFASYKEWIIKVCEIFLQSRTKDIPPGYPRPSRQFGLLMSERFDIRSQLSDLEISGFFENQTRIVLEFSLSEEEISMFPVERLVFEFFPPKDLPPGARLEDRKNYLLPKKLSVATRIACAASRLLPAFNEYYLASARVTKSARSFLKGQLRFEAVSHAIDRPLGAAVEICSLPSAVGILKFRITHQSRPITTKPGNLNSVVENQPAVLTIDEGYVRAASVEMIIEEGPSRKSLDQSRHEIVEPVVYQTTMPAQVGNIVTPVPAIVPPLPIAPIAPTARSTSTNFHTPLMGASRSLHPNVSPIVLTSPSSSRWSPGSDLMTDIWPMNTTRRSSFSARPGTTQSINHSIDQVSIEQISMSPQPQFSISGSEDISDSSENDGTERFFLHDDLDDLAIPLASSGSGNLNSNELLGRLVVAAKATQLFAFKGISDSQAVNLWDHFVEIDKNFKIK